MLKRLLGSEVEYTLCISQTHSRFEGLIVCDVRCRSRELDLFDLALHE